MKFTFHMGKNEKIILVIIAYVCGSVASCVQLFAVPWTVTCQAPLSMEFFRQEYWGGLPFPNPVDFPDPGIEPAFLGLLHWQVGSLPLAQPGKPLLVHITPKFGRLK